MSKPGKEPQETVTPLPASTVLLLRDGPAGIEVFMVERPTKMDFAAGALVFPGGKVDPGETPEIAAIRECREELDIGVSNLEYCGEHRFQFVDGYSIHVWVYRTRDFEGIATESPEAEPLWTRMDQIPFEKMWEDDKYWLPMVVRGERFQTRWIFDGDRMVDYAIEADGNIESWGEIG